MPIHLSFDRQGFYYQYGSHGHKYYFNPGSDQDDEEAYKAAARQAAAIHAHGSH